MIYCTESARDRFTRRTELAESLQGRGYHLSLEDLIERLGLNDLFGSLTRAFRDIWESVRCSSKAKCPVADANAEFGDVPIKPDGVFYYPKYSGREFYSVHTLLEARPEPCANAISSSVLGSMADLALRAWEETQPTRLFVPYFYLHGLNTSLVLFVRTGYYCAIVGQLFHTLSDPSADDVCDIEDTLRYLWFLLTLPADRFGHIADVYVPATGLKFARLRSSPIATSIGGTSALDYMQRIPLLVSLLDSQAYLFKTQYHGKPAMPKLVWTPTCRLPEAAMYDWLLGNACGAVPNVCESSIVANDIFGYRLEYLLIEDCGVPLLGHFYVVLHALHLSELRRYCDTQRVQTSRLCDHGVICKFLLYLDGKFTGNKLADHKFVRQARLDLARAFLFEQAITVLQFRIAQQVPPFDVSPPHSALLPIFAAALMDISDQSPDVLNILRRDPLQAALTSSVLRGFHISKQFSDNSAALTSLDYDASGSKCITTSLDESLRIYDCVGGKREQVLFSKKYGCNLAQFTSQAGCVAYASTKINDTIRYLSYDTNQYIRYFVDHTRRVTSLQRSPTAATVMSAALDGVVNVWDLGSVKPASTVTPVCAGGSVDDNGIAAAYDPSGMVIAVAVGSNTLQMYDVRELSRGPFKSRPIVAEAGQALVAGVRFIPPLGNHIMLTMTDGSCHLLDAFSLQPCAKLQYAKPQGSVSDGVHVDPSSPKAANGVGEALGRMQSAHLGQNVTVTPDGKTVMAGGQNGSILFWDISRYTGADALGGSTSDQHPAALVPDGVWNGSHDGPAGVCAFNPHIMECITGAQSLAIWTSSSTY
ncbi:hypothetical protein GGI20_002539 [Coemansia sp. BCRC 34301]|nr:hypothetical protein GGI20_002539 [Coemansia sp. BCRC 34301]